MTFINETDIRNGTLRTVAEQMLIAARTAPKGRGIDHLVAGIIEGPDIHSVSQRMIEIGNANDAPAFLRDAQNILMAPVMVLLGTTLGSLNLKKCGLCGFDNCAARPAPVPCVFNTGDLGIAIGSAVSVAMACRVDNRIMYTAGFAARELGIMGPEVRIAYAVPLSATAKNPFFDRPA